MSDIGERFREKAGLTEEKIIDLVSEYHHSGEQNRHILAKNIAEAALNKAFSTKLDGRYVLALIDTKGEVPDISEVAVKMFEPRLLCRSVQQDILQAGFTHKVVHMFGEKE